VRSILVLAVTASVLVFVPGPHARADDWPPQVADSEVGKHAIQTFDTTFAAFGKKDLDPVQLLAATKSAWDCGTDYNRITSVQKSSHERGPLYDESTQMMPTAAGAITLKDLGARCKTMYLDLKGRKAVGCGSKDIVLQQAQLLHGWGPLEDFVAESFSASPCSAMPKKSVFPAGARKLEAKFKQLCGKGAIYVIEDNGWRASNNTGKPYRAMQGKCWEKGALNFGKVATD
jgi:hypothetical protein